MLKADIAKGVADAAQLGKEIAGLDEDVSIWEGDKNAATKVRQIEKTDLPAKYRYGSWNVQRCHGTQRDHKNEGGR